MAKAKDIEEDPKRDPAREAAGKIKAAGKAGSDPMMLFQTDDRHLAHLVLEEIGAAFPRAECRANWQGKGEIEVWSGPNQEAPSV